MIYERLSEMTKRDSSVLVRITENAKATLEEKAKIADESLSSFMRKISLGYKIVPPKEIGIVQGDQLDVFAEKELLTSDDRATLAEFEERISDQGYYKFDKDLNLKLKELVSKVLKG